MSKKTLFLLTVIAVVVLGLWWQSGVGQKRVSSISYGGKLFPDLMEISAEIDSISIRENTHGQLTFVRDNNIWVISEVDNFPANLARIRQLIHEMSNITRVEAKTTRPENYPLLGVEKLDSDSATGTEIRLMVQGDTRIGLIIGRTEMPLGTYVRNIDELQSWLTDSRLIVQTERHEWLLPRLTEFKSTEIAEIRFTPTGGTTFSLQRDGEGLNYSVVTESKEQPYQIKDQRAGDVLTELAEQLAPLGASRVSIEDELHEMAQTEFVRFDGASVRFLSWQDGNGYFVLYPPKSLPEAQSESEAQESPVTSLWRVAISEVHYNRLNRQLTDVANPAFDIATDEGNL